jgi:hypothetical protein
MVRSDGIYFALSKMNTTEVIGNIHENPQIGSANEDIKVR